MCTLIVHSFVFAYGSEQKHIPLTIVGNAYHTVEIEKGISPTLDEWDGKRRIVFVNKLQPESTTVMVYPNSWRTAKAFPCPAYITKRKRGICLQCRSRLITFSFHGYSCRLLSAICLIANSIFPSSLSASCITSSFSDSSVVYV